MKTARCAVAGLDLCGEAAGLVHEFVAADLGAAAILLAGAVRATLLSVDFNLGQLPRDSQFCRDVLTERHQLHNHALQKADALVEQIAARKNESTIQCPID